MAMLVVKSYLEMPDMSVETRRCVLEPGNIGNDGIFQMVHGKIGAGFPDLKDKRFSLFWKDEDEDYITVSTDEEMQDVLSNGQNGVCRIYIKVNVEGPHDESKDQTPKAEGNHEKKDPWEDMTPPFPPHAGFFSHHPPSPGPFGYHGPLSMGVHCGPWGWRGRGRHAHGFGGHYHPHHFLPGHHRGHHHGGHHPFGHMGKHHGHGGRHGWKDALRNSVPMPHRRWAKSFIQSWRTEHLKNATSTSDSDGNSDGKNTMANAGVPPAYADWLKMKLERWHKKWCSDEMNDVNGERTSKKEDKKIKKALKASVPIEFVKWTKWYLNSHFGKRDAPKFMKHGHGWDHCQYGDHGYGGHGRENNGFEKDNETDHAAMKKCYLYTQVPQEYRACTKRFIRNWRVENKLDGPNSAIPSSSEDCDTDMEVGGTMSIPEAYKQWLEIFLLRWHTWRGQLERNPGQSLRGGMGLFKMSVPMEFRAWVKYYLAKNYNKDQDRCSKKQSKDVDQSQRKFEKMFRAFQTRWLRNQQDTDKENDTLSSSSSDEESLARGDDSEQKGEPETSFERLSLGNDSDKKRKVHFDGKEDSKKDEKRKKRAADDSDKDDKVPKNNDFRQWTRQAMAEWDGETVAEQDADEEMELLPNQYRWMSKMMTKMQMKKMKQQVKDAKREMKAAKKQQKNEHV